MHCGRRATAQKAVVAAAVLFLVANTFINFHSWQATDISYDPSEYSRRLEGRPRAHTPRDRVINDLIKQGIRPGNRDFRRLMKARLERLLKRNEKALSQRNVKKTLRKTKNIWYRRDQEHLTQLTEKHAEQRNLNLGFNGNLFVEPEQLEPLSICNRPTMMGTPSDLALLQKYNGEHTCPGANSNKLLLLRSEGPRLYGRTGNNLIEFLHSLQFAREQDVTLGIMSDSWAFGVVLKMWMSIQDDDWEAQFEKAFCVKIFHSQDEVKGYLLVYPELTDNRDLTERLFKWTSNEPLHEYIGDQSKLIQSMYKKYNTGEGTQLKGAPVRDMCSGIKALFGDKKNVIYSVIHQRSLEGAPGEHLLKVVSKKSGCDPVAALHMSPDYVKSILKPLGMLKYPIVLITDGQEFSVMQRLLNDPEISPNLRLVPEEATWVGGDITLAVMSDVFIGNPVSTFSGFIAKSRLALGKGHSYLFRAKNEKGEWHTTCGDTCIFDKKIMGSMS